jgi:hypothetical protein
MQADNKTQLFVSRKSLKEYLKSLRKPEYTSDKCSQGWKLCISDTSCRASLVKLKIDLLDVLMEDLWFVAEA